MADDVATRLLDGGEAVAQRAQLGPALRDRELAVLAHAVEVDRSRDDVDRAGAEVGGHDHGDVLVQHPLREAQGVLVPERAAPQLVLRHPVRQQPAEAGDVRPRAPPQERLAQERRRPRARAGEAVDVPGGEVRAGALERAEQQLERVGRQLVVAVHEREVVAGRGLDAGVAGVAEAVVGLAHEPQPRVALGVALGDRRAPVGGAVVDHHHLEVADGLAGQRQQAFVEIRLDVVDRHDDADPRHPRPIVEAAPGEVVAVPCRSCSGFVNVRLLSRAVPSLRRRLLGAPAVALHRLALALVRRLPPPRSRPRAGRPPIRIVLANAHAMGGTIRATLDLAGRLAQQREVEVIALRRQRSRRPFFPFPPGVAVTVLDDRGGSRGLAQRALARAAERARPPRGLRLPRRQPVDRPAAAAPPARRRRRGGARHAARLGPARRRGGAAHRRRRRPGAPELPRPPAGAGRRRPPPLPRPRRARRAHRGRPRGLRAASRARVVRIPNPTPPLARRARGARRAGRRGRRPAHQPEGLRPADRRLRAARPPPSRVDAAHPRRRARAHRAPGPDRRRGPRRADRADGPDAAARRGARRGEPVRAQLALRGLRPGHPRGDEPRAAGRELRLPARAGRDRHRGPRRDARPARGRRRP